MNRDVYKHLLSSYGRNPNQWIGFVAILLNVSIVRVYAVIVWAQVAANVASHHLGAAKLHILYYLIAYVIGSVLGVLGELLSLRTENNEYGKLMMDYYEKLINKDMSFYRDNQTGYLTSVFRQYLDSSLILVRFLRGEAAATVISLVFPTIVLTVVAPKVGIIAIAITTLRLLTF